MGIGGSLESVVENLKKEVKKPGLKKLYKEKNV